MSSRGSFAPSHRRVGGALGYDCELEPVTMRCSACGTLQTEDFDADASLRSQMAHVVCLFCGRIGTMARAPKEAA